jgi:hypothetical protein
VLLFLAFGQTTHFRLVLYGLVTAVGVLVGLEIPLLLRLLRERLAFSELVAQVLSLDYAGALLASLAFPLLLVPRLGLIRTSLLMGLANAAVGLWSTWIFRSELARPALLRAPRRRHDPHAGRGHRGRRADHGVVGGAPVRRRDHPDALVRVSAHRAHPLGRRRAALPQRPSSVLLA